MVELEMTVTQVVRHRVDNTNCLAIIIASFTKL